MDYGKVKRRGRLERSHERGQLRREKQRFGWKEDRQEIRLGLSKGLGSNGDRLAGAQRNPTPIRHGRQDWRQVRTG